MDEVINVVFLPGLCREQTPLAGSLLSLSFALKLPSAHARLTSEKASEATGVGLATIFKQPSRPPF